MEPTEDLVVVFSTTSWDGSVRRGYHTSDRVVPALLRSPRLGRVMVVNCYRSVARRGGRWLAGDHGEPFPTDDRRSLYQPFRWRATDPTAVGEVAATYRRYAQQIGAQARRRGLSRPRVLSFNPLAAGFGDFEWAAGVTFFAEDDLATDPALAPWRPAIETAHRRIAERGAAVGAVSQVILDRVAPRGRARVIPNGVDATEWTEAPPAGWLSALPAPRILYLGVINERIDVDAVRQIAERFADGSVMFVGEVTEPAHLAPLRALPNVHFHGRAGRRELAGIAAAADVCVLPHRVTSQTRSMSPLKVYEYLAAGRPVAATALDPIRNLDERIVLVEEGEDFGAATAEALALGPADAGARRRFAAEHGWDHRVDEILDLVLGQPPVARTNTTEKAPC